MNQTNTCSKSPTLGNEEKIKAEHGESEQKRWGDRLKEELRIDSQLVPFKVFYFIFFAGFGASFPYLPLYFKQLGLSASLVGLLAGIRPLIQFIGSPFWSFLADRFHARKCVLLFSIFAWLVMTLALLLPVPQRTYCKEFKQENTSANSNLYGAQENNHRRAKSLLLNVERTFESPRDENSGIKESRFVQNQADTPSENALLFDISPTSREHDVLKNTSGVTYVLVRDESELNNVFMWLLFLTVTGEFLEVPSFILADTALLQKLDETKRKHYGKTRLFGSVGFAAASFVVGGLLDTTQYEYCGRLMNNYNPLFFTFAAVMVIAFIFGAWIFEFDYNEVADSNDSKPDVSVCNVFLKFKYSFFIIITWFLGFNHGLLFNFLNWYLEDLGASKLLMGTGVLARGASLSIAFFFHGCLIDIFGHLSLIFWTLASYVILFVAFSVIINPWWAVPLELYHGLLFGTAWSTLVVYLADATPKGGAATMQGTCA